MSIKQSATQTEVELKENTEGDSRPGVGYDTTQNSRRFKRSADYRKEGSEGVSPAASMKRGFAR
jgi:hypothetical protein